MEFTAEQIEKKYELLPEDIKKAVSSIETTDVLIDIGKKYNLHVDKVGDLIDETTLVMIGLKPTSSFVGGVQSRLGISRDLSENLVREVNEKILMKVRESLRKIHQERQDVGVKEPEFTKPEPRVIVPESQNIEPKKVEPVTENLERESILKEIEEPIENITKEFKEVEKTTDDISTVVQKKPMVMEDQEKPSIVGNKLNQVVKEPISEEKIVEEDKLLRQKNSIVSTVDPYREPVE